MTHSSSYINLDLDNQTIVSSIMPLTQVKVVQEKISDVPENEQIKLNEDTIYRFSCKVDDTYLKFKLSEIGAFAPYIYEKNITLEGMKEIHRMFNSCENLEEVQNHINKLFNDKQIKLTRHIGDSKKNIPTFLFDTKLSSLLGKKRKTKINFKNEDSLLPSFLKNKKEESNVVIDCKGGKNISKSIKKIDKKKAKILNMIEHDKQSTTVEDNEYNNL